jgi:hypothetical protein
MNDILAEEEHASALAFSGVQICSPVRVGKSFNSERYVDVCQP